MSDVTTISVGEDYDVLVGHGVSSRVAEQLPEGVARVLVVHGGRIVEDGSPAELVAAGGRFAALHRAWEDSLVTGGA